MTILMSITVGGYPTITPLLPNLNSSFTGFIFRHIAGGRPTTGLYAEYDTVLELGKGSFATVFKAVHRATGTWVAVKQIYQDKTTSTMGSLPGAYSSDESLGEYGNPDGIEIGDLSTAPKNLRISITREIGIMRNLLHPNITELKAVFFQTGTISKCFNTKTAALLFAHRWFIRKVSSWSLLVEEIYCRRFWTPRAFRRPTPNISPTSYVTLCGTYIRRAWHIVISSQKTFCCLRTSLPW
jgi:serine/threonine protein kinase